MFQQSGEVENEDLPVSFCLFCYKINSSSSEEHTVTSGDNGCDFNLKKYVQFLESYVGTKFSAMEAVATAPTTNGSGKTFLVRNDRTMTLLGACERCSKVLSSFCELYCQIKSIHQQIEGRLAAFVKEMETAEKNTARVKLAKEAFHKLWWMNKRECYNDKEKQAWSKIEDLRTDVIKKCTRRLMKSDAAITKTEDKLLKSPNGSIDDFAECLDLPINEYWHSPPLQELQNEDNLLHEEFEGISTEREEMKYSPIKEENEEAESKKFSSLSTYICSYCPERFTSRSQYSQHLRRNHLSMKTTGHSEDIIIENSQSGNTTSTTTEKDSQSIIEEAIHHDDTSGPKFKFRCEFCSLSFFTVKSSIIRHLRNIHSFSLEEAKSKFSTIVNNRDFDCSATTPSRTAVVTVPEKPFKCHHCPTQFSSTIAMRRHTIKFHNDISPTNDISSNSAANTASLRKYHLEATVVGKESIFRCGLCPNKIFSWKRNNLKHLQKVHSLSLKEAQIVFQKHNKDSLLKTGTTPEKPFQCDLCEARFTFADALKKHKRKFHGEAQDNNNSNSPKQRFRCPICSTSFKSLAMVHIHKTKYHKSLPQVTHVQPSTQIVPGNPEHTCPLCRKNFSTKQNLQKHRKSVHLSGEVEGQMKNESKANTPTGETIFSCGVGKCVETFELEDDMNKHRQLHDVFKCNFCSVSTNYAPNLSLHEIKEHSLKMFPREESPHVKGNDRKLIHKCPRCQFQTPKLSFCVYHHIEVHLQLTMKVYSCQICRTSLTSKKSLSHHFLTHHDRTELNQSNVSKCDQCPAYFLRMSQLMIHKRDVHGSKERNQCPQCDKMFTKHNNLQFHLKTVHKFNDESEDLPIACEKGDCKKRFLTQSELEWHQSFCRRDGTPVAWVRCPECDRECKGQEGLKIHRKIHKHPTEFVCEQCGLEFKDKRMLKQHYNFHLTPDEWKYQCEECGKKCQTSSKLREHMRTHTGERPFECTACGRKFASAHSMRKHVNRVHKVEGLVDIPIKKSKPKFISRRDPK